MIDKLQQRLEILEGHMAHQELAVETLNQVILKQQQDIVELKKQIDLLKSRLENLQNALPAQNNHYEKPPHY